jgi:hypothetical protein
MSKQDAACMMLLCNFFVGGTSIWKLQQDLLDDIKQLIDVNIEPQDDITRESPPPPWKAARWICLMFHKTIVNLLADLRTQRSFPTLIA